MKNVKLTLILIFCLLLNAGYSQIEFSVGYSHTKPKYPSFTSFTNSMVSYYGQFSENIIQEVEPYYNSGSLHYEAGFQLLFMELLFSYNRVNTCTSIKYTTGDRRQFDITQNCFNTVAGFGYGNEYFGIFATGGFCSGVVRVDSYFVYPDGTINNGYYYGLNGKYRSYTTIQGVGGLHVYLTAKKFGLFARAEWLAGDNSSDLNDPHYMYVLKGSLDNSYLPQEYEDFEYEPFGEDDQVVKSDLKGFRLTVGIRFHILSDEWN
ncbi:MAG: hypothetical protein C0594_03530 [Marinilabiliales bacterium]|nr:MAG: hypothetical protein C0594_03530 [Marinilabiliales bacterium]